MKDGNTKEILDIAVSDYSLHEVTQGVNVRLLCVQDNQNNRT